MQSGLGGTVLESTTVMQRYGTVRAPPASAPQLSHLLPLLTRLSLVSIVCKSCKWANQLTRVPCLTCFRRTNSVDQVARAAIH